jgi:hypothetical protein
MWIVANQRRNACKPNLTNCCIYFLSNYIYFFEVEISKAVCTGVKKYATGCETYFVLERLLCPPPLPLFLLQFRRPSSGEVRALPDCVPQPPDVRVFHPSAVHRWRPRPQPHQRLRWCVAVTHHKPLVPQRSPWWRHKKLGPLLNDDRMWATEGGGGIL